MDDVVLVKIGGGFDPEPVLDDVAELAARGMPVVVVHGGGAEVDRLAEQLGVPVRRLHSPDGTTSRRTDGAALGVLTLALLGRVKPALVSRLRARGVDAIGLSGADGGLVTAQRRPVVRSVEGGRVRLIRDDRSGRVTAIRRPLLDALLATGAVPVVSPPAVGADGELLNVDADQVAAEIAVAVEARALVLLSDVPGVLADPGAPDSVRPVVVGADQPGVTGRMRHKLRAGMRAAERVQHVVIASGAAPHPVRAALEGRGTLLRTDREHP